MADSRGLGRLPSAPDDRDRLYPMRSLFGAVPPVLTRHHRTGPVLDQGNTSQCVGYAFRQLLNTAPVMQQGGPSATDIYREAQRIDEWPGEQYDGTSVRAGAKVLHAEGYLSAYHWATRAEDVRDYILTSGPVVVGTDWLTDMFTPDKDGYLPVSGSFVGGHAYVLCGYSTGRSAFRIINSWGKGFGQAGRAWIRFDDFARLLSSNGEACAAVELRRRS